MADIDRVDQLMDGVEMGEWKTMDSGRLRYRQRSIRLFVGRTTLWAVHNPATLDVEDAKFIRKEDVIQITPNDTQSGFYGRRKKSWDTHRSFSISSGSMTAIFESYKIPEEYVATLIGTHIQAPVDKENDLVKPFLFDASGMLDARHNQDEYSTYMDMLDGFRAAGIPGGEQLAL